MKRIILIFSLLLLCSSAFANPPPVANAKANANARASANADASSRSSANVDNRTSVSPIITNSNSNPITNYFSVPAAEAQPSGGTYVAPQDNSSKNTVVVVPSTSPTATCLNGISLGGGGPGGAGGIGFYWEVTACRLQEISKQFYSMGMTDSSLDILCQAELAQSARDCAGHFSKKEPEARKEEKNSESQDANVWK